MDIIKPDVESTDEATRPADVCNTIAEKAAAEFEASAKNPYFATRPDELHDVLVRIIRGAHVLMVRAGA